MPKYIQQFIDSIQSCRFEFLDLDPKPNLTAITQCIKRTFQDSPSHKNYDNIPISIINIQQDQMTIPGAIPPNKADF